MDGPIWSPEVTPKGHPTFSTHIDSTSAPVRAHPGEITDRLCLRKWGSISLRRAGHGSAYSRWSIVVYEYSVSII